MEDNRNNNLLNDEALDDVAGGVGGTGLDIIRHTVVAGDTLLGLAKRYRTTVNAIMRLNPAIRSQNQALEPGSVLKIPKG